MAIKVNSKGVSHAKSLIKQGKVDKTSSWSFSAEDGNKLLGDNNWSEYAKWFLAIDTEANEETKERYKFPYGKNGKVYRRGVIAAKQRAAQQGYDNIVKVADELLALIDDSNEGNESKKSDELFYRAEKVEVREDPKDERTFELSVSSEYPVKVWGTREILVHSPEAVDLSFLSRYGVVLDQHDPKDRIGVIEDAWLDETERKCKIKFRFVDTEKGRRALEEFREGVLKNVSIGYSVDKYRFLEEGETYDRFEGPAIVATRWTLKEVSLVSVPADPTVGFGRSLADLLKREKEEGVEMPKGKEDVKKREEKKEQAKVPEVNVPDGKDQPQARQESPRVEALISQMGKRYGMPELALDLIERGVSVDEAKEAFLEALAKKVNKEEENVRVGKVEITKDGREKFREAAVDALLMRIGQKVETPAEGADSLRGLTLYELAKECLRQAGVQTLPGDKFQLVRSAFSHSSSDFPIILMNVVNKNLMAAYNEYPVTYPRLTRVVSASDFKEMYAIRLGSFGKLDLIPEGGEYKEKTISEEGENYRIGTYGAIFSITRQAIINDDLNAFTRIPSELGRAARRTIEMNFYELLESNPTMSDGKLFFIGDHGNLASTAGPINEDTLREMDVLISSQKDVDGNPIALIPGYVIVPPSLWYDAKRWLTSPVLPGKSNNEPNVYANWAEPIKSVYLKNASAWYVFCQPGGAFEIAFLDGNQSPTIETKTGFEVDGQQFKVRLDFGVGAVDYRLAYKNNGA